MYATELKCLGSMPLFKDIAAPKLKLVAMTGTRLAFDAGDRIIEQGQPPEAVFIVLEGEVEIRRQTEAHTVPIARRGSGYICGDIAALLGEPYPVTVSAATSVTALRLDANVFLELVRDVPELSMALIRDLARRVVNVSRLYVDALPASDPHGAAS